MSGHGLSQAATAADEQGDVISLLVAGLDRFLRANYSFERRRAIIASEEGMAPDVWKTLAELGVLGAAIPEEFGGGGLGPVLPEVMEAFGRALVVEPYVSTVMLAASLIAEAGSDALKKKYLPDIAAGHAIWGVAFAEAGGRFNLDNVRLDARRDGDAYVLNGRKAVVFAAHQAGKIIVSARTSGEARDGNGISLFIVDRDTAGLSMRDYPTMDGMRAADLDFADVRIPAEQLLGKEGAGAAPLAKAVDIASVAICAEALGAMAVLNEKTLEHCKTRVVFDQPLSKFQVVQHRLVEMAAALEQARAITGRAQSDLGRSEERRSASVSAMKYLVAREAVAVAKEAVQLHGAMGITDELDVSHYFKRITAIATMFGDGDHHIRRFIANSKSTPVGAAAALAEVTELKDLSPEEIAFRDEIRRFYAENLTDDLRQAANFTMWHMTSFEYGRRWQKILFEHGYGAPNWPVEYGGCHWSPTQRLIWAAELARARPPLVMGMGHIYAAPCIMKFGTDEQKQYFLPRILAGEDWWAQGYSEPGAGSDLASLSLRAHSDGDHYVLNGSKIWTTMAHHANRIFCLVRTATGPRKQAGITFLLIDMDTPGIEIRPIVNLAGDHDFNQVFFTDVRVPKSRRLGGENDGWTVARYLLQYEHGAHLHTVNFENQRRLGWVREIASLETDGDGGRLLDDVDFSRRIAELAVEALANDFACQEELVRTKAGEAPQERHALLSIRNKALGQKMSELAKDAVAYYGMPVQKEARTPGKNVEPVGPEHALLAMPFYLTQRGATIAGGAPEIQRNNLAKRFLHL
ncbi:MAG TPA: acyl-CoA dehydrogenase family protein [Rhizomicrobium sp.]